MGRNGPGRIHSRRKPTVESLRSSEDQAARHCSLRDFHTDDGRDEPDGLLGLQRNQVDSQRSRSAEGVGDLYLPKTLFGKMMASKQMDRISFIRSMRARELVHFNGQYHCQTGRALNVAVGKEIPAFGSVIA